MKDRFLQLVSNLSAAPSLKNLVRSKFGIGSSLARPRLAVNFCSLSDIGIGGGGGLDLLSTKGQTGDKWHRGGHSLVTLINDRAPRVHNGNEG